MGGELARLVERHGGVPISAPALLEAPVDASASVTDLLDALASGEAEVVVFLTGVGAEALFEAAERIGRGDELVRRLQATVNVARGQKPARPLKQRGVPVSIAVYEPYTTTEVIAALDGLGVGGRGVALLHYGERSEEITSALLAGGARLHELMLYEWRLPPDTAPLEALIREVIAGSMDAVAFTSQVQLRHLLLVAERSGVRDELIGALNERTVVAAVGPTCASALRRVGIRPKVVPDNPKMGPMVVALAAALDHG
jgi:uroporphyrinogen-III synthase